MYARDMASCMMNLELRLLNRVSQKKTHFQSYAPQKIHFQNCGIDTIICF